MASPKSPEQPIPNLSNLSPEKRKLLKEAQAFMLERKKHPDQAFSLPLEFLRVMQEAGLVKLDKPEQPKQQDKPKNHQESSPELAESILGIDFLSPDKQLLAGLPFRFPESFPAIPFSQEDLERAKELNQMLIYYTDRANDGTPLTIQKINTLLQPEFTKNNQGKILYNIDWYKDLPFFTTETIQEGWYLVSKDIIPDSTSKNYLEQTQVIKDYITNQVFKDQPIPEEYQQAIDEFTIFLNQNPDIQTNISSKDDNIWKPISKSLSELKINQMTRPSPLQVIYNLVAYLKTNPTTTNNRLLEKLYTNTSRLSPDGGLVVAGSCGADGASLLWWRPDGRGGDVGASFSRSPL